MGAPRRPQPVVASTRFLFGPPVVRMAVRTGPDASGPLPVCQARARTPHVREGRAALAARSGARHPGRSHAPCPFRR